MENLKRRVVEYKSVAKLKKFEYISIKEYIKSVCNLDAVGTSKVRFLHLSLLESTKWNVGA